MSSCIRNSVNIQLLPVSVSINHVALQTPQKTNGIHPQYDNTCTGRNTVLVHIVYLSVPLWINLL